MKIRLRVRGRHRHKSLCFFCARGVIVFGLVVRTRVILLIKDFRRKIKLFFASTFASSQLQIGVVIRSIDTSEEASR